MTTRVESAQFCGILSQRLLAPTVDIAHQHLHPGPAEDSVRAHVNEETTLPRVLAVERGKSPGIAPGMPCRRLLGPAILADLAFAESLIATEYAQFLQGKGMREWRR